MSEEEETRQLLSATAYAIQRSAENRQATLNEFQNLRAENARLREALQHAAAAMKGMASDQLTPVETAILWNATMESIRAALEGTP